MKNKPVKTRILSSLLLVMILVACSWPTPGRAEEKKGNVRLVHILSFEPFAKVKDGKSEGLAVDILTAIFAKANMKVAFIGEEQEKAETQLFNGEAEGLAFFGINPARKNTFDFSNPYLISGGALFTKAPNPPCSDLKELEGKTVATPLKGPLADFIREKFPKVNLYTDVKDYQATLEAVLNGKADAAALNTQAGAVLGQNLFPGKFSHPSKGFLEVPIGIAVLKGKQNDLLGRFNEGLRAVLADGTYDKIIAKWGVPASTKPSNR
jgi:ABC-type amino acid transport substrate-binding protein